jgi:tRNA-uridine 2-sulfurtransferase
VKVLVAMSGGVDSSVAAALLRDDGHDVVGVTMKLWGGESDTGCCSVADVDDARRVAQQLGIDHVVFNFGDDFATHVVEPYVAAHVAGRTPNPCVECNRHLKFARLAQRAEQLGFDALATGHHARVIPPAGGRGWRLARGADRAKDQSYVLHMLDRRDLARTLLPVGELQKTEVRARAAALGLRTAGKADSQDVCFITSQHGRRAFVGSRRPLHPATVVDTGGRRLGVVPAVELVTVGQRKGLGGPGGRPAQYVVDVDVAARLVTVGPRADLLVEEQVAQGWRSVDGTVDTPVDGPVLVQVSAHGQPRAATLVPADGGAITVRWHDPERRVAPGQSVVAYDPTDAFVLGGGLAA